MKGLGGFWVLGGLDKVFAGPMVLLRIEVRGRTGNGRSVSVQLRAMSRRVWESEAVRAKRKSG